MGDAQPLRTAEEVLSRYQSGERNFRGSEPDEAFYDFRGVDLSGADFSHSSLVADFRNAYLRGATFTACNLKTCDFRGADLRDAVFCEAHLEGTEFAGTILDGANFENATVFSHRIEAGELPDW